MALCGQSVLAAATLAVQGHADIELPTGQTKPLSEYFLSIAETGERKSAADKEALWPVRKRETALRQQHDEELPKYENRKLAWEKARDHAIKGCKGNHLAITKALEELGPAPATPLVPWLTCSEPTSEGLFKLLATGQPSIGVFSSEGGQFIGGHGMKDDAKLRTATGLSAIWDGEPIKRVRAGDGISVLPGRRLAMHLMVQPDVATIMLSDPLLLNQGLLSRCLVTAPESKAGTRSWQEAAADAVDQIKRYGARLLSILEQRLPLVAGRTNELVPRVLTLAPDARTMWVEFYSTIESQLGPEGPLASVRGLANKLPEHAARLAGVLALVADVYAEEVSVEQMGAGITLAQHYLAEALRLFQAAQVSRDLKLAQALLAWLDSWTEPLVSLPDIYQKGPNAIRDKATAARMAAILVDHGHLVKASPAMVLGHYRRETWRIVKP